MTIPVSVDCYHCGLAVVTDKQFSDVIDGELKRFCCPACKIVAQTIISGGMQSFYQFRTRADSPPTAETLASDFDAFDDPQFYQRFVTIAPKLNEKSLATVHLLVGGIHCTACIWLLENYLQRLTGVERISVSLGEHKATLVWDVDRTSLSVICGAIAQLGYLPEPYSYSHLDDLQKRENRAALRRLGIAGIAMMQVAMFAIALYAGDMQSIEEQYRNYMRWVSMLVATPVVFYSAVPFFVGAWRGLKMKKPGMDLPVAIAIALAYSASCRATLSGVGDVYFDSVTMFTFLLLSGRYLEMRARHFSGRLNSNDLNSLLPSTATVRDVHTGQLQSVPLFVVKKEDVVVIKPGQVIPADGRVLEGSSGVDESQLTGEFMLQNKTVGDSLVAGTLNASGLLVMQVEAVGAQLQLQAINSLLSQAQSEKPLIAQWADHIASYFVVIVVVLSLATYLFWHWFDSANAFWITLSVLVVSCPCALSLATPVALIAATSRLRKAGLLVTSAQVWEKLPTLTHVIFDKTGTLTEGKLTITAIHPQSTLTPQQCFALAAALEVHSEHPIASAFKQHHSGLMLANDIHINVGEGIEGSINNSVYRVGSSAFVQTLFDTPMALPVMDNGQWVFLGDSTGFLCHFQLQDTVRSSAPELVTALKARGLQVHMLSGDHSPYALALSNQLGLDHCVYGASPEDKLTYILKLQRQGDRVLMMGDGINDIPVLAAADVSVAMCHASNLAKTHADCILLSGELTVIIELLLLAKKTKRIIWQNLLWALTYNLSAIPLAAMAMIAPYVGAVGMSLSSLVVVLNALRLQRAVPPKSSPTNPLNSLQGAH